jgi:hypothetical protein
LDTSDISEAWRAAIDEIREAEFQATLEGRNDVD